MSFEVDFCVSHLEALFAVLAEEKIDSFELNVDEAPFLLELKDLLWKILSHPRAEIQKVTIYETKSDALAESGVLQIIGTFLEYFQTNSLRSIHIWLDPETGDSPGNRKAFEVLVNGFQRSNNKVENFFINELPPPFELCCSFLRPVIEHPNNRLTELSLIQVRSLSDNDALALSEAMDSPHCKLRSLDLHLSGMTIVGVILILDGLRSINSLEKLHLLEWQGEAVGETSTKLSDMERTIVVTRLTRLLKRPGNQLTILRWQLNVSDMQDYQLSQDQVSLFADTLINEHCRLQELDCDEIMCGEDIALPLFTVLAHSNCRLKSLKGYFSGKAAFATLGDSLRVGHCQLEVLDIDAGSYAPNGRSAVSIVAHALRTAPSSRLRIFRIKAGDLTRTIFCALADSLLTPSNKLTQLSLMPRKGADTDVRDKLYRALRKSNVTHFTYINKDPFCRAFNAPSTQVMYALLSMRLIPRLGQGSWMRLVPMQDFILKIAETLGWRLDHLRV